MRFVQKGEERDFLNNLFFCGIIINPLSYNNIHSTHKKTRGVVKNQALRPFTTSSRYFLNVPSSAAIASTSFALI